MMGPRTAALAGLEKEVEAGTPAPPISRKGLRLDIIAEVPGVFQPRDLERPHRGWSSATHVKTLRNALRDAPGHRLDPILVWWSGRRWCVVDGHHRLEAYRGFYGECPKLAPWVPAREFKGDLWEARKASAGGNSKDKLAMSAEEKSDAAWRLTCARAGTRREISECTGVCGRTLTKMNGARDRLEAMGQEDLVDLSWEQARSISEGRDLSSPDHEWAERQAEEMAAKLRQLLGPNLIRKPDILAMALSAYHPDLPKRLLQHVEWQEDVLEVADQLRSDSDLPYGADEAATPF